MNSTIEILVVLWVSIPRVFLHHNALALNRSENQLKILFTLVQQNLCIFLLNNFHFSLLNFCLLLM